jgi:hypothetical protein
LLLLDILPPRMRDWLRRNSDQGLLAPAAAIYDFVARPEHRRSFGGPLNGQAFRRLMVEGIINACDLRTVIETGAYRGTTTEFFAERFERVWTIEHTPRYYWYTRLRMLRRSSVNVVRGDSRAALLELARDSSITSAPTLFYLDAHWDADLPLAEEIEIIAQHWRTWVAVIDDFKVPGDDGYGFDTYGPNATLDAEYCSKIDVAGLRLFYPALHSTFESGCRRGSAVLVNDEALATRLGEMSELLRSGTLLRGRSGIVAS